MTSADETVPMAAQLAASLSECMNALALLAAPKVWTRARGESSTAELRATIRTTIEQLVSLHADSASPQIVGAVRVGGRLLTRLDELTDASVTVPDEIESAARDFLACFGAAPPGGWDDFEGPETHDDD